MAVYESPVSERGGLLSFLVLAQLRLNLGHPRRCLLMTLLRSESVKHEGLIEILQTAETA